MSLEPARKDFTVWRGATFHTRLQLLTGDTGSPAQDLTGYSASCSLRDPEDTTIILMTLTNVNGGVVLGGAAGTVDIIIDDAVTTTITWPTALYELFLTDAGGDTDIFLHGTFKVKGF